MRARHYLIILNIKAFCWHGVPPRSLMVAREHALGAQSQVVGARLAGELRVQSKEPAHFARKAGSYKQRKPLHVSDV